MAGIWAGLAFTAFLGAGLFCYFVVEYPLNVFALSLLAIVGGAAALAILRAATRR